MHFFGAITTVDYEVARARMVKEQLIKRGIHDERVLKAIGSVPRHKFIDQAFWPRAYGDHPLPIGHDQTISQPYIVALMTEALELKGNEKVLEIGTGSGYQAAILAELAERVFSIERIGSLADKARKVLESLNYYNVLIRVGDGTYGWREESPFDAIIVTAGAPDVPRTLLEQLAIGGRLVVPTGDRYTQKLLKLTRTSESLENTETKDLGGCRFVNLIGEYGWKG